MTVSPKLIQAVKDRVIEADQVLGGMTDEHLKWIKGWSYYRFNRTKYIDFLLDFNSKPRKITVIVRSPDGKIMSKAKWLWFRYSLWRTNDEKDMCKHLGLDEWIVRFVRSAPKVENK